MSERQVSKGNDGSIRKRDRLWSPVFVTILACTLCMFLVGQGANAGTSVYIERIGGTAGLAGIGALCFSVAAGVARIVSGPLIDMRGRQIVMIVGALIMLAGTVGPLVNNQDALFILWRALQGAGFSAATTAAATASADVLPFSRMGEGIGYYGLGQAISMSVGPALAIFLVSTNPPENFYYGISICSILAFVLACFIRYEKHPQALPETSEYYVRWKARNADIEGGCKVATNEKNQLHGWRKIVDSVFEPSALPGTIPILFMCAAFSFNIFYMGLFGSSLGVGNSGIFYSVTAVVMIVIRLVSGRFMDKVAPIKIMGAAVAAGLLAFAMLLICSLGIAGQITETLFYLAGIPFGLCMGIAIPINQTIAVRFSPGDRWGAANALFMLGIDIGNGVLSVVWGFLSESVGFSATIVAVIICLVVAYIAAHMVYPKER